MQAAIGALVSLIDSTFPGLSIAGDSKPATSIFLSHSCLIVEAELQLKYSSTQPSEIMRRRTKLANSEFEMLKLISPYREIDEEGR